LGDYEEMSNRCVLKYTNFFFDFEVRLIEQFPAVFKQKEGEGAGESTDARAEHQSKWGWLGTIDNLANGDVLKWDRVTELPITQVFTYLSLKADEAKIIKSEHLDQMNKLKSNKKRY
jgi:hypothetical protein